MNEDPDRVEHWDHRESVWHDLEGAALEALEAIDRVLGDLKIRAARGAGRTYLGLPIGEWQKRKDNLLAALDAINDRRTDDGEWLGTEYEDENYGEAPKEKA